MKLMVKLPIQWGRGNKHPYLLLKSEKLKVKTLIEGVFKTS